MPTRPVVDYESGFGGFEKLMPHRIKNILMVASLYDSFLLADDDRLNEALFSEILDNTDRSTPQITRVSTADKALARLEQKPFDLYKERLKDDATVIVDTHLVKALGSTRNWNLIRIPLIYETKKQLGNIVLTSVVTLSLTQKITGIVQYKNMEKYIREWAPPEYTELNLKAIQVGQELVP